MAQPNQADMRPYMDITGAKGILDKSEDQILHLLEEGRLAGIDISVSPGQGRREIRISVVSLQQFNREFSGRVSDPLPPLGAAKVMPISAVARVLNCGWEQVVRLVKAGVLQADRRRRPKSTAYRVHRDSLAAFLKERAIR